MNKIWCIFSVANNYDQPKYNLEIAFSEKPTYKQLKKYFNSEIAEVINKDAVRFSDVDYRLEEIEIGRRLDNE